MGNKLVVIFMNINNEIIEHRNYYTKVIHKNSGKCNSVFHLIRIMNKGTVLCVCVGEVRERGAWGGTSWIRAVLNALYNFVTNKIFLDKYSYQTTCIFSLDP